jgi:peptidoglycan/LPS O-acetylase OafA/YrhL
MTSDTAGSMAGLTVPAPNGMPQPVPVGALPTARPSARFLELDSLRGLAAVAVVAYHFTHWPPLHQHKVWLLPYIWWGRHGVDLFFVISGFVILMTARRGTAVAFAKARFARLFPAYWFCLALTFLIVLAHARIDLGLFGASPGVTDALVNLTMTTKFFGLPYVDPSYWTLSFELAFYVAIASLVAIRGLERLEEACLAWLALDALAFYAAPPQILADLMIRGWGHLFIAGMMLFRLQAVNRRSLSWVVLSAACAFCLLFPDDKFFVGERFEGVWEIAEIGLVALSVFRAPPLLRWRPLLWLGSVSYPLYLIHQNLGYILMHWLWVWNLPQHAVVGIAAAVMLFLAWAISRLVELPGQQAVRSLLRA